MDSDRRISISGNQKGFALVYVALMILVLFGTVGLAVDIGHLYVVRGQLQNAADAAALAGAWSLYRDPLNPGAPPALNWDRARAAATSIIQQNKTDKVNLTDGTIETGYWTPDNPDAPLSPAFTNPNQVAAVRVTVKKADGNNGGPVGTFFMKILDASKDRAPVNSRPSLATSGFPGSVAPNILFPMAVSKCMTDEIFSHPEAEWPNPVYINSPYGPGGPECDSGQWTSFKLDRNDVNTLRDLMKDGNPDPLKIGDSIWIEPGAEGTMYQTNKWTPPLPAEGMDVVLAIVDSSGTDLKTKGERTITGFAMFHIEGTTKGTERRIYGHFTGQSDSYPTGISPGGPQSNIVTPPVLVQ